MNGEIQDQDAQAIRPESFPGGALWGEAAGLVPRGALMGVAEVIPGVSGGTIALITGIYTRFVNAIKSADAQALRLLARLKFREALGHVHWKFLVLVFAGQGMGIAFCTRVVSLPDLLKQYPEAVLGLFFGLVIGSILLLAKESGWPGWRGVLCYLAGGALGLAVVMSVPADTPDAAWFLFLCGVLAISAWILPGISGSYTLLLLKKYELIWSAVAFKLPLAQMAGVLLPFGLGALVGIAAFSRVLSWIFKRWEKATMMAMNGLLIASLYAIFPFQKVVATELIHKVKNGLPVVETKEFKAPAWPEAGAYAGSYLVLVGVLMLFGLAGVLLVDGLARRTRTRIHAKGGT